ncbi:MAG: hypothetical protein NWR52_02705, partial [Paracoccaceae bacterium]|nr:hypothetical protein [Paracoccaceae bacterium]
HVHYESMTSHCGRSEGVVHQQLLSLEETMIADVVVGIAMQTAARDILRLDRVQASAGSASTMVEPAFSRTSVKG